MQYYKKVDTDTELCSKKELNKSKLLTAKMAHEITNEAMRKQIQDTLLPKIKNAAEKVIQTLISKYQQILIINLQFVI